MDLVRDSTVQEALKEEFQLPRYNTWANRGSVWHAGHSTELVACELLGA